MMMVRIASIKNAQQIKLRRITLDKVLTNNYVISLRACMRSRRAKR